MEAYLAEDSILASAAQGASTPSGYINAFTDLQGSTQQIGYLTYKTIDSGDYDVKSCADFCDSEKYCLGFNIYYERDPSVEPADSCANPDPITNVKCALYGYPVASGSATNYGQWRNDFHVVIAGSNGKCRLSLFREWLLYILSQEYAANNAQGTTSSLPQSPHYPASTLLRLSPPLSTRSMRQTATTACTCRTTAPSTPPSAPLIAWLKLSLITSTWLTRTAITGPATSSMRTFLPRTMSRRALTAASTPSLGMLATLSIRATPPAPIRTKLRQASHTRLLRKMMEPLRRATRSEGCPGGEVVDVSCGVWCTWKHEYFLMSTVLMHIHTYAWNHMHFRPSV